MLLDVCPVPVSASCSNLRRDVGNPEAQNAFEAGVKVQRLAHHQQKTAVPLLGKDCMEEIRFFLDLGAHGSGLAVSPLENP